MSGISEVAQNTIVETKGITRVFEFGETQVHALNGIDLNVQLGEFIVILGPSGAGKTTLLNMIGGIDHPTDGEIVVDGSHLDKLSNEELNTYRRDKVGWVFQFFNIVDSLRAWENVGLALEFQGMTDKKQINAHSYEILDKVEIGRASCRERV